MNCQGTLHILRNEHSYAPMDHILERITKAKKVIGCEYEGKLRYLYACLVRGPNGRAKRAHIQPC